VSDHLGEWQGRGLLASRGSPAADGLPVRREQILAIWGEGDSARASTEAALQALEQQTGSRAEGVTRPIEDEPDDKNAVAQGDAPAVEGEATAAEPAKDAKKKPAKAAKKADGDAAKGDAPKGAAS
jgi:hypothetical protein